MESAWLGSLLILLVLALVLTRAIRSLTVFEFERGVKFSRGRFAGVLEPGIHWFLPYFTRIQKLDTRPTRVAVTGQEVLSSDGVAVKTSIAATFRIVNPEAALLQTDNYQTAVHTELQLALRSIISALPVEELLAKRPELAAQLKALASERLQALGIELQDAALRDLTFPGELKKIFTQVVKARQEGLAALEKARGETAALRNLANAAQMIERNPQLMHLRLLQVLGQQPGNSRARPATGWNSDPDARRLTGRAPPSCRVRTGVGSRLPPNPRTQPTALQSKERSQSSPNWARALVWALTACSSWDLPTY